MWPAQGAPSRVSAIVMLRAGPGNRLSTALRLAQQQRAPMLVVSQGQHGLVPQLLARPARAYFRVGAGSASFISFVAVASEGAA